MQEIITMVEGEVDESNWEQLLQNYQKETHQLSDSIKQIFLIQSQTNPKTWRIMTHWRSQHDLDEMRASTDTPVAVRVFMSVGAFPLLVVWDAKVHKIGNGLV